MALIRCSECGQMVSDKAATCPKCGNPITAAPAPQGGGQQPNGGNNNWLYWLIGGLALLGLILFFTLVLPMTSSNSVTNTNGAPSSTIGSSSNGPASDADYKENQSRPVERHSANLTSKDYRCGSESNSHPDDGMNQGSPIDGKSVEIKKTWLEHDVNHGIKIHVNMNATNLLNTKLTVQCTFWFKDGRKVTSTDGNYETHSGQIATIVSVNPDYQNTTWSDLQLWIPYSQVKGVRDRKHLKCRVEVYDGNHCLATSQYMHFDCWLY